MLKPAKCTLFREEVEFLGHLFSREGVQADPANMEQVATWATAVYNKFTPHPNLRPGPLSPAPAHYPLLSVPPRCLSYISEERMLRHKGGGDVEEGGGVTCVKTGPPGLHQHLHLKPLAEQVLCLLRRAVLEQSTFVSQRSK